MRSSASPDDAGLALPLSADDPSLPAHIRAPLSRATHAWMKNTEVLSILQETVPQRLPLSAEAPLRPPGGSVYLFDRKVVRFFRKDGHSWRKKADGKTVRETHEKLKVGNVEMLNCYYAHSEREDGPQGPLQRRCYWQLEADDDIVLVHYVLVDKSRGPGPGSAPIAEPAMLVADAARLGLQAHPPAQQQAAPMELGGPPPLGLAPPPLGLAPPDDAEPLALPAMSMDSFLATLDDHDTAAGSLQAGGGGGDALLADPILPSWEELLPPGSEGLGPPGGAVDWQGGGEAQELGALQAGQVVHAGGSLRLIEPMDAAAPGQGWAGEPLSALGTRQMSHDQRQSLQSLRRPSFARGTARLSFQDSLYATKQDSLQRAAEAMQTAGAALQGVMAAGAGLRQFPPEGAFGQAAPASFGAHQQQPPQPPQQQQHFGLPQDLAGQASAPFSPAPPPQMAQQRQATPFGASVQQAATASSGAPHASSQGELRPMVPVDSGPAGGGGGGLGRLAQRSASVELRGPAGGGGSGGGEVGAGDVGGSKARGGGTYAANKAIALEAELSALDAQLVAHLRQPDGSLASEAADRQVRAFEAQLARMESASGQLLRSRSSALPDDAALTSGSARDPGDNASTSLSARNDDGAGEVGSALLPFEVLDFAPDWDFCSGGAKLMVACSFVAGGGQLGVANARLHVMFDRQQVLATVLRPGVVRVRVPPHDAGPVELRLTLGDGVPRSRACAFTYRALPEPRRGLQSMLIEAPDRELQSRLIGMLMGGGSEGSDQQDSGGAASSGASGRHGSGANGGPAACELAGLSFQQGERLLALMLERRVQGLIEALQQGRASLADLDALHEGGQAYAHLLAGLGHDRALDALLAAGADPGVRDAWGHTPLHWAAAHGHGQVAALLLARRSSAEALTFLTEADRRRTPADAAADAGHAGLAAFLADAQLAQGVRRLAAQKEGSPAPEAGGGAAGGPQRKRSRRLPDISELREAGEPDSPAARSAVASPKREPATPPPRAPGEEAAAAVATARSNAEQLETTILRRAARRAVRNEKRARAQRKQADVLARLQARRAHWQQVQQLSAAQLGQQHGYMGRYLGVANRIADLQMALEGLISAAVEKAPPSPPLPRGGDGADYGSDSDLAMCRRDSVTSRAKLQHIHNSRRLDGRRSSLPRTPDQDIRSILRAGLGVGAAPMADAGTLKRRARSRSSISRALQHVELLQGDARAQAQFQELREQLRLAEMALRGAACFKFARTAATA